MAEVTLKGVCKVYEDQSVRVVTDVNLQIADREFVVLVGPSGCGKSTTLRMIAGLEEVSEGEIRIGGRVVNDVPPSERDIAMVFQDYALYPHMTVYQNMAFSLKLRNLARVEIDRRVQEAARMLSLEPYLERRPKALSGGQRQRVAMGRAIVREPAVFLFDEPLSNLDAKMRVQMRAELAHLHERLDATMIYVTHDQIEAMTLGDRIVVMSGGVVQQCAAPLTVYAYPANAFVARFIGTPPMNLFEGRLEAVGDSFEFVSSAFRIPLPDFMRPALAESAGKPVLFGVRPEDLRLVDAADGAIPAVAKMKETLGNELIVHLEQDGKRFLCRVDPYSGPRLEGTLHLRPVLERCHVFDAATEVNLTAALAQQRPR
jgi:multiple sugar transport system ATP-binding protein